MDNKTDREPFANLGGLPVGDGYPVRVMGVINVSPESFFKASVVTSLDTIKRTAVRFQEEGADILDVGARSSAPYLQTDISISEEVERISRAVRAVREVTDMPISVDTYNARAAHAARDAGANLLNDISGLAHDAQLPVEAKLFDGVILKANAEYANVLGEPVAVVRQALRDAMQRAQQAGIPKDKVVLDPGIGYFRNREIAWDEWDREILRGLTVFRDLHVPIMVGLSRKSFIGKVLGYDDPSDRLYGSLGMTSLAVMRGVHMIRTHDVRATRDAARIAQWFTGARNY